MFVNVGSRILRKRVGALSDPSYNVTAASLTLSSSSNIKLKGSTIAGLPASPVQGQLAFVTNAASSQTNGSILSASTGSTAYLVSYNGSNWLIVV
jgi:hypothetical protein